MIRVLLTSCILLALYAKVFSQNDTSIQKSNDSLTISASLTDTMATSYDTPTLSVNTKINNSKSKSVQYGSNEPVYKLNLAVDIPVTAVTAGWSLFAFPKIYDKDPSTDAAINNLSRRNINGIDRWASYVYSEQAAKTSDLFFYASMPLPVLLFLDRDIRKDALKVGFLYLEAMSVTGLFYTGSAYVFDRYRPSTYNPNVVMSERTAGNQKNSFIAGHPALVATSTFFIASVYSDYHPDSKLKYVFYGAAAVATGTTAYLRHRGGKHFPTDLLVGTTIGTLSGILVPKLHKNKAYSSSKVRVMPFTGESHGLNMVYRF